MLLHVLFVICYIIFITSYLLHMLFVNVMLLQVVFLYYYIICYYGNKILAKCHYHQVSIKHGCYFILFYYSSYYCRTSISTPDTGIELTTAR